MKIGDKVKLNYLKLKEDCGDAYIRHLEDQIGDAVGEITEIKDSAYYVVFTLKDGRLRDKEGFWKGNCLILFNNLNTSMKITNLVKKILDKDTRTLVSAGFINGDLALTEEGVSELLGILFLEKKADLLKVAEEKLNENNK